MPNAMYIHLEEKYNHLDKNLDWFSQFMKKIQS